MPCGGVWHRAVNICLCSFRCVELGDSVYLGCGFGTAPMCSTVQCFATCLSVRDKCARSADLQVCSPGQKSTAESYSRMLSLILGYYGLEHAQTYILDLPTDVYWNAGGHCYPFSLQKGC